MFAIQRALYLRFLRLRVWLLALAFPALAALLSVLRAGPEAGGPSSEAARVVLSWLQWALPPLAALFLLTCAGDSRLDLLLVRPVGWPAIVLGRFTAAVALFGGCHLLLAAALFASLHALGGGPEGRVERGPEARSIGAPERGGRPAGGLLRPWPAGAVDPDWLDAVGAGEPWSFVFTGLSPGRPCRARVRALIARILTDAPSGGRRRELGRARSAPARADYLSDGGELTPIGRIELRDAEPVEIAIPAAAVGPSGRLVVVLSRVEEESGEAGETSWGPRFFWFDPEGGDPSSMRDLWIAAGSISFASNALRASLRPLGALLLMAALGAAAAALFSPGVALGFTLAVYLLSISKGFLMGILGSLSRQSALELLSDPSLPSHHLLPGGPTWFDRSLEAFLGSCMGVLPDFQDFLGLRFLAGGDAVRPAAIARSLLLGAGYAAVLLGAALILPGRKERRP